MRNFFHLTISIILGSFLGYGMYNKILKRGTAAEANNITVDTLFFADNAAFEKKQMEALTLSRTRISYPDTLQVSAQLFEISQPVKNSTTASKGSEVKHVKIIETMRPIEVAQLQKPKTISIPVTKKTTSDIIDVASAQHIAPTTVQEVSVSASTTTTTENNSSSQEQTDKKKFLFFNKKSKNN